jgi:hypothetical protein
MSAQVERTKSTTQLRSSDGQIYVPTAEAMRTTFFWAAGLASLGTGLLPVRLNIFVSIGAIDLLTFYGRALGQLYPLAVYGAAATWLAALLALGFAGRTGHRWAFLVGMILYAADMIALVVTFSLWAFGLHAFFVFKWFQGQKALKDLNEAGVLTF